MKQIIQDLNSGKTILENIPAPAIKRGHVVIQSHRSLVSLGTERMLVEFGKANYLEKVRQQPEKVKQVLDKIKSDGLRPTIEAVFRKLGEPLPLGYCNAGEVIEVAPDVKEFKVGDRVVSNGPHAEIICVPKNLVAKIPENVSYDHAVFTVIGSIGLQGIRLLEPKFGETVVVTGLGLIGLLAGQILVANGCHTIGFDFDNSKVELAKSFGIDAYQINENMNPVSVIEEITQSQGADAVLITASTKSNDVISQSAQMCRKNGKIVLVGVIGLNINRSDFYKKEISFQVSCSYGPGRYDENYEEKGYDYPISHVRWTEKRNFQAILQAISKNQIKVEKLISEVIDFENYNIVYDNIAESKSIASVFKYDITATEISKSIQLREYTYDPKLPNVGIIGAGQFTSSTVLPNLKKAFCNVASIASSKGLSGTLLAKKFGIAESTTDLDLILNNEEINTVIITTRHNSHAELVVKSLNAGKHVFVEKPLALTNSELNEIEIAYNNNNGKLMVGFNRRFSPFSLEAKKIISNSKIPINIVLTMNAGFIPSEHWVHDPEIGGGRIIGEACHMIDLATFFIGSKIIKVTANGISTSSDNVSILLHYANGSNAVVNYFSNGSKAYSKERIEIFSQNKTIIIDNFKRSEYYGYKSSGMSKSQDKGHAFQFKQFMESVALGTSSPIPFHELLNTSRAAIAAVDSLKSNTWINI